MALIVCPLCVREDDVSLIRTLPDGRQEAECRDCNFTFTYGAAVPEPKLAARRPSPRKKSGTRTASPVVPPRPIEHVVRQFPTAADVAPADLERAEALKREFLAAPYDPDPRVAPHWAKFGWVFSADGLDKAVISDLKLFADDPTGGRAEDGAALDKSWLLLGEFESSRRVRAMTQHLLRGPGALEDRLTALVSGSFTMAMPGWGESLLTKTLAVVDAERFAPILTYDRKRAIAGALYGVELPEPDETSWTIGRLAAWSNDLLVSLLGGDFVDLHHAAAFLRWAEAR